MINLLLFLNLAFVVAAQQNSYVSIQPAHDLLLGLDGSDSNVKLQQFTGSPAQLWRLEATPTGTFYVFNKYSNLVLDVDGKVEPHDPLVTKAFTAAVTQQWYISRNGQIVNNFRKNQTITVKGEHPDFGSDMEVNDVTPENLDNPVELFIIKVSS